MSKVVYKEPKTMYEVCSWDITHIKKLTVYAESDKSLWVEVQKRLNEDTTTRMTRKNSWMFDSLSAAQEYITVTLLGKVKRAKKALAYAEDKSIGWRNNLQANPDAGLK